MTIDEAKALAKVLADNIQKQVRDYQSQTGLFIHSIPVQNNTPLTTVDVKVQLNNPR